MTDGDEVEYKDYLKKVNILSTNRDLENEVKKGAEMLSVNIEKTPFYQMGVEEGIKEGIREGIREGMENTLEKVVIGMLKTKIDIGIIHKITGLDLKKIEELKRKILIEQGRLLPTILI